MNKVHDPSIPLKESQGLLKRLNQNGLSVFFCSNNHIYSGFTTHPGGLFDDLFLNYFSPKLKVHKIIVYSANSSANGAFIYVKQNLGVFIL
jgi:hypothetical protein